MKRARNASALVAVLVVLTVASVIAAELVQTIILRQQASRRWVDRRQAQLLAESALERAWVMRRAVPEYAGETWAPDLADGTRLVRHQEAIIKIDSGSIQVQATVGAGARRVTYQLTHRLGDEP